MEFLKVPCQVDPVDPVEPVDPEQQLVDLEQHLEPWAPASVELT